MTQWIEEQAEEYRKKGSTKPYTDAEIDVYYLQFRNERGVDLEKFRRTLKKKRQQGRKEWIEWLEGLLSDPRNAKRRDLKKMLQHYRKHARSYKKEQRALSAGRMSAYPYVSYRHRHEADQPAQPGVKSEKFFGLGSASSAHAVIKAANCALGLK